MARFCLHQAQIAQIASRIYSQRMFNLLRSQRCGVPAERRYPASGRSNIRHHADWMQRHLPRLFVGGGISLLVEVIERARLTAHHHGCRLCIHHSGGIAGRRHWSERCISDIVGFVRAGFEPRHRRTSTTPLAASLTLRTPSTKTTAPPATVTRMRKIPLCWMGLIAVTHQRGVCHSKNSVGTAPIAIRQS